MAPSGAPPCHGRWAAEPSCRVERAFEGRFVVVAVQTQAGVRDPTPPLDRSGLDHDEPGPGVGELRKMLQVPVRRRAVAGAVLAHWCDHEAVRQGHFADCDRLEQTAGHERSH